MKRIPLFALMMMLPLSLVASPLWGLFEGNTKQTVEAISQDGTEVLLEGGGKFTIHPCYRRHALSWEKGDRLSLLLNPANILGSRKNRYLLHNETEGGIAEAALMPVREAQKKGGIYIQAARIEKGQFWLTDGTKWNVHPDDLVTFRHWKRGDLIILGDTGEGWGFWKSATYPQIALNGVCDEYVRVEQF